MAAHLLLTSNHFFPIPAITSLAHLALPSHFPKSNRSPTTSLPLLPAADHFIPFHLFPSQTSHHCRASSPRVTPPTVYSFYSRTPTIVAQGSHCQHVHVHVHVPSQQHDHPARELYQSSTHITSPHIAAPNMHCAEASRRRKLS